MTEHTGPQLPAEGENGRWVLLGTVGVDSAHLCVGDPAMMWMDTVPQLADWPDREALSNEETYNVQFMAGFGDGEYEVWGLVVDYGEGAGERIAQVVITLIDSTALMEWREDD